MYQLADEENCEVLAPGQNMAIAHAAVVTCTRPVQDQAIQNVNNDFIIG